MRAAISGFADVWGTRVILALTLVLCGVVGLVTPYVLGVVGLLLLIWKAADGTLWSAFRTPAARGFGGVFAVLLVCFAVTAKSPHDVLYVFNFSMLILFAAFFSALYGRRRPDGAVIVARLSLTGVLLCLTVAYLTIGLFQMGRTGYGLIGVIVLSNTAILLGFLGLIGVVAERGWVRWLYLAGPVAGVMVAFLSGSRGPLIAVIPLSIISAVFLARTLHWTWPTVIGFVAAGAIALAAATFGAGGRISSLPHILDTLVSGGTVTDETTVNRLDLYQAAWRAFTGSPVVGYGWAHLMEVVRPFLNNPANGKLPQLHNDLADFAVAAGSIGIIAYVALLVTPIAAALSSPRDSQFPYRLFGCSVLVVAYLSDGLTDLMFGFEFHTALYAAISAILLGYCLDREATA